MRKFLTIAITLAFGSIWAQAQEAQVRIGIIGLDTSHVTAFTALLNDPTNPNHVPGARVVAAYKGGSPDIESSATRIEKFTSELQTKWNVELVSSIEELCRKVDAVLLESVDGRPHLAQVRPVMAARKRVFIDKPFAGSYRDAQEIVRLSKETGTPFFSTSSLRFVAELQNLKRNEKLGDLLGAFTFSPAPTESHHPDLFWYGIHGVEMLFTLMGPGCESVTRVNSSGVDVVVGRWSDGRIGTFRGIRDGKADYGAIVFGSKGVVPSSVPMKIDYRGLVVEIVKFFQTGTVPVSPEETLEVMAFMEAADLSKSRGGQQVKLSELNR
ncbi:MAG: gfo/Idh/MocA family oxidoreductase [Acidobacteria bacterium]|nr:gfo/Idh/MocA family oxidoreductase [Acidobacteriota bacterium]